MSTYVEYTMNDGTKVLIEADMTSEYAVKAADLGGNAIIPSGKSLEEALGAAKKMVSALWHELTDLDADETEVTYGIKTTGEAGLFAVCKLGVEANYTIKLKWSKKPSASSNQS